VVQPDIDVAVIGAGLMGAASAWALSRRGVPVTLIEARDLGHTEGSSHGSARIFRRVYPDPLYVELTGRARELWQEVELAAGELLLRHTGGIDHGRRRHPRELADVLRDRGVPAALLSCREASLRWPGIAFDGPVLFQPDAGVIDADRAVAALVRCAVRNGAEWCPRSPVRLLERVAGGVRLHLPDRSVLAGTVVVAAGGWLPATLAGLVDLPPLTVTQQQVFHFPRRDPAHAWPVFVYLDRMSVYGLPGGRDGGPAGGVKVAEHDRGQVTTADTRTGVVDERARQRLVDFVRAHLPGLEPTPFAEKTCLYTSTANEDFILDRVGPLVICSACSGHGAKFAPLVGEFVADLATGTGPVPARFTLAAHAR
jgi:sarcosine oxidase